MSFVELLRRLFGLETTRLGSAFPQMLDLASTTFEAVHEALWTGGVTDALRQEVYARDVRINQLQREIRKEVFARLLVGEAENVGPCIVLINVTKDAERIGDYVKNLVDPVIDLAGAPNDALVRRVRLIGDDTGRLLARVRPAFEDDDDTRAERLLREGRACASRCDDLVREIAKAELGSGATTSLVLLARFYKRLNAHATNILSAVVMPLHKMDYFDEEALDRE